MNKLAHLFIIKLKKTESNYKGGVNFFTKVQPSEFKENELRTALIMYIIINQVTATAGYTVLTSNKPSHSSH
jgi:hypothetical protein